MLPLADPDGRREAGTRFRLDGLMARAMDQDLLPVLLALRSICRFFDGYAFSAWPGVELTCAERAVDVDLLAHGPWTACFEVKSSAASLATEQLDKLITLSKRLDARPCIAALTGNFAEHHVAEVRQRGGLVLEREELLGE